MKAYAEQQQELARSGAITDLEALAKISDRTAWLVNGDITDANQTPEKIEIFDPCKVGEFVDTLNRALGAYKLGWYVDSDHDHWFRRPNPDYVPFADTGFKDEYKQERPANVSPEDWETKLANRNQVTHFVGWLYAGYKSPSRWYAEYRVRKHEEGKLNADVRLGMKAIELANELQKYSPGYWAPMPGEMGLMWVPPQGISPHNVGSWIRANLGGE